MFDMAAWLINNLPLALNAVKLAQMAIAAGQDAKPHVTQAYEILFKGKALTDAERQAQNTLLLSQSATIQAPLPPESN